MAFDCLLDDNAFNLRDNPRRLEAIKEKLFLHIELHHLSRLLLGRFGLNPFHKKTKPPFPTKFRIDGTFSITE
jgi:hypothetical protein